MYAPRINTHVAADRYIVRHVDLDRLEREILSSARNSSLYPGPQSDAHAQSAQGSTAAPPSSRLQFARQALATMTLLQPDIPPNALVLKKAPLSTLLLWSAKTAQLKNITPPPPHAPTTATVQPSFDPPNKEVNLADLEISPTVFATEAPMPPPSKTSPVAVQGPGKVERVPETTSTSSKPPTPAMVVSVSDFSIAQGAVELPPVNETAPGSSSGALAPGSSGAASQPGKGDPASRGTQGDAGHGQGNAGHGQGDVGHNQGNAGHNQGDAGKSAGAGSGGAREGTGSGAAKGTSGNGSNQGGQGNGQSYVRITLPQNGQFGVVVVGSTLQEQFPETTGIWSGRMTYSVYLHVGLAKSWILQYSLPRSTDAAAAGYVARLDAPWPYYIVRPNLGPDAFDADALMIHGFVNETGHFEELAVVFPPDFAQAQPVLDAIRQWQFRPATQSGHTTRVEVLLVIPQESE
jgi:hypothetical protein